MKKVAIVGYGFMGRTHYGAWRRCPGARVVAVCDANLAQLTARVAGNISGVADNTALPKSVKVFADFGEMLDAGGFDIVDITLPTPLHAEMSVRALDAGFNVLCEKPMALTLADADRMLSAAARSGRVFLVAQCVRFFPEYAWLADAVRSGRYGKVLAADFTRFMAAPKWSPKGGGWLLDESKSGGLYVDAHIHDADYITSLFGMPETVRSVARRSPHGYVDHLSTVYGYPGGEIVTSDCSFAAADSLVWDAAARVFMEKATVYLGQAYKSPLTVYPARERPFSPKLPGRSGYDAEIRYFASLVDGAAGGALSAGDARNSLALVLAERRSAETGRQIRITGAA